jgi:hypothetical protein
MQTVTGSLSSATQHPGTSGLLARAIRVLTGREEVRKPSRMAWADMRPIDFVGEDTSLTQEHLELLR